MKMLIEKKCKICRKVGQKLLWNERCASGNCALTRRRTRPGVHGDRPRILSQYGRELLEKQKVRFYYLLKDKQLANLVKEALKAKEPAPQALAKLLERRLVNVIWQLGYTTSKAAAKQLIAHGHFLVNGRKVKSANYLVEPGDVIEIREQSKKIGPFKDLRERLKRYSPPPWLKIDAETFKGEVLRIPEYEELNLPFNLNLVVDFYSRH